MRGELKSGLIIAAGGIITLAALLAEPLPQDPAYHRFSDTRALFGIDNFWNVASNIPFALVAVYGLWFMWRPGPSLTLPGLRIALATFFSGVFLTAFGSAWYHLDPGNGTLVWDRLPMTLAFMSFFGIVIGEHVSVRLALRLFPLLLMIGAASVFYWAYSEAAGDGDLRFYALVQFLPMVLVPLILLLYRSAFDRVSFIWGTIAIYALAKGLEAYDRAVFDTGIGLSGHSLKHIVAAAAPLLYLYGLRRRKLTCSAK